MIELNNPEYEDLVNKLKELKKKILMKQKPDYRKSLMSFSTPTKI